jgi:hypothetical protein
LPAAGSALTAALPVVEALPTVASKVCKQT